MSDTFACPFCNKNYPRSASLLGRKLRCSACKNIIQLKGDGSVVKIAAADDNEKAPFKGEQDSSNSNKGVKRSQLTSKQKKQVKRTVTKSIERGRSLLNSAAQQAVSQVDSKQQEAVGPGISDPQSAKNRTVHAASPQNSYKRVQKSVRQSSAVVLSIIVTLLMVVVLLFAFWEPSAEIAALKHYASAVAENEHAHPHRMRVYRDRMWLHTRDGTELPPVVLNADKAQVQFIQHVSWDELRTLCNDMLKGMSLMRRFGMWVSSDKQVMVDKLWKEFEFKANLPMFYDLLRENNVTFLFCDALPDALSARGASKESIYIISLLLAGTGDQRGGECRDFGLASDQYAEHLDIYEFTGEQSLALVDKNNEYTTSSGGYFCGYIVGFTGVPGTDKEYRIIDIRFARSMQEFCEDTHNPLRKLVKSARLRMIDEYVAPAVDPVRNLGESND